MKHKQKIKNDRYESVKIRKDVVILVRENKKTTGVPIGSFFELSAIEKLNKNKNV